MLSDLSFRGTWLETSVEVDLCGGEASVREFEDFHVQHKRTDQVDTALPTDKGQTSPRALVETFAPPVEVAFADDVVEDAW